MRRRSGCRERSAPQKKRCKLWRRTMRGAASFSTQPVLRRSASALPHPEHRKLLYPVHFVTKRGRFAALKAVQQVPF